MDALAILGIAVAFDLLVGEYPAPLHPVVWMGKIAQALLGLSPTSGALRQFFFGAAVVVCMMLLFTVPAWLLLDSVRQQSSLVYMLLGALILKPTFSFRALWVSVGKVYRPLTSGDLDAARRALGMIVSRDVTALSSPLVAGAAIESAAENLTDSVVAPLCYFALLGPPAALAYRVANTLDAMVGYRGQYEYLGKAAARLDDVLSYLPARLAALLVVGAARAGGGSASGAWRTLWRDHGKTESPNAGWTMSAMAGALGVRLEKLGVYRLGAEHREPRATDIRRALRIVAAAALMELLLVAMTEALIYAAES